MEIPTLCILHQGRRPYSQNAVMRLDLPPTISLSIPGYHVIGLLHPQSRSRAEKRRDSQPPLSLLYTTGRHLELALKPISRLPF